MERKPHKQYTVRVSECVVSQLSWWYFQTKKSYRWHDLKTEIDGYIKAACLEPLEWVCAYRIANIHRFSANAAAMDAAAAAALPNTAVLFVFATHPPRGASLTVSD